MDNRNVALKTLDAQLKHMSPLELGEALRKIAAEVESRKEEERERFELSITIGSAPAIDKQPQALGNVLCIGCAAQHGKPYSSPVSVMDRQLRLVLCEDHRHLLHDKLDEFERDVAAALGDRT